MIGLGRSGQRPLGQPLVVPGWPSVPGLHHGFLDRAGSAPAPVAALLAAAGLGGKEITTARQVHGSSVVCVGRGVPGRPVADALLTTEPGVLVGVVTADCVPLLVLDRDVRAAAAVHVGWRGAAAGVIQAVVAALARRAGSEPARLEAAVGPAIGGCCYEVGEEVRAAIGVRPGEESAWRHRGGRLYLDLRRLCRARLAAAGLEPSRIAVVGPCTQCSGGRYASYRRDGAGAGRQLSFIGFGPRRQC